MQIPSHPQQSPKSYLAEKLYLFITPIMKFQFIKPYAEWIYPISVSTAGAQVVSKGFKANSWFTFCPMTHLSKEKYKWSTIQASVDQGESNERKFHNTVFKIKTVLPRKRTTSVDLENAKETKPGEKVLLSVCQDLIYLILQYILQSDMNQVTNTTVKFVF